MARITAKTKLDVAIHFTVDESEARALEALAGYGDDAFVKVFYEKLGRHYLEPHENGLRRFLTSIRRAVSSELRLLDKAREALTEREEPSP